MVNYTRLNQALHKVSESAKRLNDISEDINRILLEAERHLVDENIGLETWLYRYPLHEDEFEGGSQRHAYAHGTRHILGFCRIDGRWQLAAREVVFEAGYNEGNPDEPWENVRFSEGSPAIPIQKAGRELRLAAVTRLPDLLELIAAKADEAIEAIAASPGDGRLPRDL